MVTEPVRGTVFDRADVYEAVYRGRGKDYPGEADLVATLVRERCPGAASLLDVGCGPGPHLEHFAGSFDEVSGVDLSEDMVRLARERLPGVPVETADMRDFDLGRRFDAVVSMFNAVAYLETVEDLVQALTCFARHLNPGGVVVIEPWWLPEEFTPGHVGADIVRADDRTVARFSHSVRSGLFTCMTEHYLVASPQHGVEHFTDSHRLRLFTRTDYEQAFTRAGCSVRYLRHSLAPRGLFVGVRAGPDPTSALAGHPTMGSTPTGHRGVHP